MSRRGFLAGNAALLSTLITGPSYGLHAAPAGVRVDLSGLKNSLETSRSVDLLALHTMESLKVPFWQDGSYAQHNLSRIAHVLRDHRTNEVHSIDPLLLEYVYELAQELNLTEPVHVISGYRSPATNAKLRQNSSGVAKRSFHMQGRAIDIRFPGVDTATVRDAAVLLRRGGVGYYPGAGFVHLDTGPARSW